MSTSEERSPAAREARLRLMAAMHRTTAAQLDVAAAITRAAASISALAKAMAEGDTADIAAHPDLAYLDLQMHGFYDDMPGSEEQR